MSKELKFLIEIVIIGVIIFVINTFFFQICFVNGDSMNPTFRNGQILLSKKINIDIGRNDIVVIRVKNKTIIKRVVGVPDDRIKIHDGYVYVNDEQFDNRHINDRGNVINELALKEDEYFVLGDNRDYSIDSRFDEIGIIHKKDIIAKIIL